MYIPADELKRSARLASDVSESALRILDIAEGLQDRNAAQALIEVAQRLVGVSAEMNRLVVEGCLTLHASCGARTAARHWRRITVLPPPGRGYRPRSLERV